MTPRPFVALVCFSLWSASAAEWPVGPELTGWSLVTPTSGAALAGSAVLKDGGVLAVTGQPAGYLLAPGVHDSYRLHVEWRWTAKPGNGGVLVHVASGPLDRNLWPKCVQVQTKHLRAGDLLPMAGAAFAEPLTSGPGTSPAVRARTGDGAERPAGEWNTCEITCRAGAIAVAINGVEVNRVTHCDPRAGRVGFQLEGAPYELRHVRIEPLAP